MRELFVSVLNWGLETRFAITLENKCFADVTLKVKLEESPTARRELRLHPVFETHGIRYQKSIVWGIIGCQKELKSSHS